MVKAATAERYQHTRTDTIGADVGRRIRGARQERGMSLAQVGGEDLSRSFLSLVELGRSRISLRALSIVAERLELPISYFLDDAPGVSDAGAELALDRAESALLRQRPGEALQLLEPVGQPSGLRARALWLRGWALADAGRPREAISPLQEALNGGRTWLDSHFLAEVECTLASALQSAGNDEEALLHFRNALKHAAEAPEDPALLARITACLGHVQFAQGDTDAALEHYARARELINSDGNPETLATVYGGLSRVHEERGRVAGALHYSRLGLGVLAAAAGSRATAGDLTAMARHYEEVGDLDHALECAREALARAGSAPAVAATAHSTLASILLERGETEGALAEAEAADRLATNDRARVGAWLVLARVAETRQDADRTDDLYRRALEVLRGEGRQSEAGIVGPSYQDAALAYSLVLRRRGDTEGALEYALQAAQAKAGRI